MTVARPSAGRIGLVVTLAVLSVAVSAAPRVLLAAGSLPTIAKPFVWSDVFATYVERLGGTALPYFDAFFEYPPVIGYVAGVLVRTTTGPAMYVLAWAALCAAGASAVAWILSREVGPRAAILWSISPQLLLFGALNFDVLAVAALVGAVHVSRSGHGRRALAVLAVGALTKAFPALVVPAILGRMQHDRGNAAMVGLAVFASVAALVALPSLLARHPFTEGAAYVGGLTNFDSAWGLVVAGARGVGIGGIEGPVLVISTAGAIAMYAWALWRTREGDLARSAALAVIAVLLWSRLYSPQYSLWLVPFFALGVLPRRAFALLSLADLAVFATVYPLTLVAWSAGDAVPTYLFGILAAGVVLRHVALVMAWVAMPSRPIP